MLDLKPLFTGPTLAQYAEIKRKEDIEKKYMDFVYKNPNLSLEDYKTEYLRLKLCGLHD